MNLYEIDSTISELLERLDEIELEIQITTDETLLETYKEQKKLYEDTIESLNYDFEFIIEQIAKDIRNYQDNEESYKKEAEHFINKALYASERAQKRKALIKYFLEKRGEKSIKAGNFDLRVQTNGGKRPIEYKVEIEDLPDDLKIAKTTYKPNDEKIRQLLDSGDEATKDLFQYGERGTHLRIN